MPLTGERVILREVRTTDFPMLVELRNDLDTQAWSRTLPPDYTLEMIEKRYGGRDFEYRRSSAMFMIETIEDAEAVGFVSYNELIDRMEATIGIAVLRKYWGSGVTMEACQLLLRFLFEELGLKVVRLWTQSGNGRAVGSAEKLGFRFAARHRQAVFKAGEYHDNLAMDLLREEWYALHPELEDRLVDPFAST
jgi:RimJ/RimL family protein N-acetyltransferase